MKGMWEYDVGLVSMCMRLVILGGVGWQENGVHEEYVV